MSERLQFANPLGHPRLSLSPINAPHSLLSKTRLHHISPSRCALRVDQEDALASRSMLGSICSGGRVWTSEVWWRGLAWRGWESRMQPRMTCRPRSGKEAHGRAISTRATEMAPLVRRLGRLFLATLGSLPLLWDHPCALPFISLVESWLRWALGRPLRVDGDLGWSYPKSPAASTLLPISSYNLSLNTCHFSCKLHGCVFFVHIILYYKILIQIISIH